MSIAADLVSKFSGAAEQLALWNVLSQVVSTAGQPAFTELANIANAAHPVVPLSAADAATASNRAFITTQEAEHYAAQSGVGTTVFDVMRHLAGDAPGPQQLAAAVMRGIIAKDGSGPDSTSFQQGISETNLLDKWTDVIYQLAMAVLSPADAANAVVRNFVTFDQGLAIAAKSGVDQAQFQIMVDLSGDAISPTQAAEALRRGIIEAESSDPTGTAFNQAIAQGRLADKWIPVIQALSKVWPTPTFALSALLKGQITDKEATALYERLGGDPQFFQTEYNTEGNAPTPTEALQLAKRGIIPWAGTGPQVVSYEQAFKEGPWRNKWEPSFKALADYIPPPETVRTLLEQGAIDEQQAAKWWNDYGLPASTVEAYTNAANFNNTAATRGLSLSTVLDMYYGQLISADDAKSLLKVFGVSTHNQDLLLGYEDMRRAITALNSSVTRIQSLFIARKISASTATQALTALKVPPQGIDSMLQSWELVASVNVKVLTYTQIEDAWYYQNMTQAEAEDALVALGYTKYDAWVILSNKNKAPLPNEPPRIVAPPMGQVVPGAT